MLQKIRENKQNISIFLGIIFLLCSNYFFFKNIEYFNKFDYVTKEYIVLDKAQGNSKYGPSFSLALKGENGIVSKDVDHATYYQAEVNEKISFSEVKTSDYKNFLFLVSILLGTFIIIGDLFLFCGCAVLLMELMIILWNKI